MKGVTLPTETVFVMEMSPIKFGLGATDEIGYDARRLGVRKVLIVTDRHLAELGLPERIAGLLGEQGIKADTYDSVEIEPTDHSIEEAADYARTKEFDGVVAVGGGSSIDTAKAVNLLTCYPAPLLDYINKPVGKGVPVPGPLRPLIAVPTTAGTGSETTAVAVAHIVEQDVKAGVSHRLLRPALGVVDPLNTLSAPPEVTAAAGADILTHAVESYTTRPYDARPKHHPPDRPAYIGANPASDIWCERAIEYVGRYLRRAVLNGLDLEARVHLALAANYAGIGFGNAGVHIPHALAYPIAGLVRDYVPAGYRTGHPLVPHGMSVILPAPAVFRFTYPTAPERHLRAAELLGAPVVGLGDAERREALPRALIALMRDVGLPSGLGAIGYTEADVPALIEGTLRQPRLLAGAPRPVGALELETILRDAMRYW
ncbi:MAG TPA: hydroxyacid-oxoacid transhydrogenase [Methylomirabilota bacterium]|jgi:alcohol dehydrogenase class IV|nr:hydroxyacid-oxoacid transhydrogenase [Methylomirabilota bacterium]